MDTSKKIALCIGKGRGQKRRKGKKGDKGKQKTQAGRAKKTGLTVRANY